MKNALLLSLVYSTVVTVFLIAYFGSISESFHKIYKELNFSQRYILIFAVCIIVMVLLGFVLLLLFKVNISTNLGQVGDFVGGLLNPILSFLALIAIIISISLQEKELSSSVNSLQSQEQIFKTQNFESSLFNLLGMYRSRRAEQVITANGVSENAYTFIVKKIRKQRETIQNHHGIGWDAYKAAQKIMNTELHYDCGALVVSQFLSISEFIDSAGFDQSKKAYYLALALSDFGSHELAVLANYTLTESKLRKLLRLHGNVNFKDEYYVSCALSLRFGNERQDR